MAIEKQKIIRLQMIVHEARIKSLEGRLNEEENFEISCNYGYGGYGAVKTTVHKLNIICTQKAIPQNIEFALKVFSRFLSNPYKQDYVFTNNIEKLAEEKKYDIVTYAKKHKELPPIIGTMGQKLYNIQTEVLSEDYGINIPRITLNEYRRANKERTNRRKKLLMSQFA